MAGTATRVPTVGADNNVWGTVLNSFMSTAFYKTSFSNLYVNNDGGVSPTRIDISADVISTQNYVLNTVSAIADATVTGSGANSNDGIGGLDTGSFATGVWYYIFIIYNPTLNRLKGAFSLSRTFSNGATLPAGYTDYVRVSSTQSTVASPNPSLYTIQQQDNIVTYPNYSGNTVGSVLTTFVNLSCAAYVPPIVSIEEMVIFHYSISGNVAVPPGLTYQIFPTAPSFNPVSTWEMAGRLLETTINNQPVAIQGFITCGCGPTQTIAAGIVGGSISAGGMFVQVFGYYDPLN